jgi:hypothetical protein
MEIAVAALKFGRLRHRICSGERALFVALIDRVFTKTARRIGADLTLSYVALTYNFEDATSYLQGDPSRHREI